MAPGAAPWFALQVLVKEPLQPYTSALLSTIITCNGGLPSDHLSLSMSLSPLNRRGQRLHLHRLPAAPQDQGGGHQRPDGEAQVLLHLQDLQAPTGVPLQPL